MPQLSDFVDSQFAELSMAAYAKGLSSSLTQGQYVAKLVDAGFTQALAEQFATRYQVVNQRDGENGFSATLFRKINDDGSLGEFTLAIRGTNTLIDLAADFEILFGLPNSQYSQLQAYYNDLIDPGKLNLLGVNEQIFVAGHSLGGYLAQEFTAAFASKVLHAYTFNAPGSGGIFAEIGKFLGFSPAIIPNSQITNIIAQGPSLIAGLGTLQGSRLDIFIENGSARNDHSVNTSTDSLALYALFGQIAPASVAVQQVQPSVFAIPTITDILAAASATPQDSLETALDDVREVFHNDSGPPLTATPIFSSLDSGREEGQKGDTLLFRRKKGGRQLF
jgi:hypothetical protein